MNDKDDKRDTKVKAYGTKSQSSPRFQSAGGADKREKVLRPDETDHRNKSQ